MRRPPPGVLLVIAKKGTRTPTTLTYQEALEEALCTGWIDGRRNALDAGTFLQRFTPRRTGSAWSLRNVEIVARLTEAGRMRPQGLAEVERARADGRWERAYAGSATATVPDELLTALAAHPDAKAVFAALGRSARYQLLHPILTAPDADARTRRIAALIARL
jgi:uncharacterized protein YdeI (YjbR/CyaY-like superfamily)